jgi:hypothetical protein
MRVALSLLEAAGLLRRHFDLPRSAVVVVKRGTTRPDAEADLSAFCEAARLRPGQPLEVDLIAVARAADLDPVTIESRVLDWANADLIDYRPAGRDLLLESLPPPADAAERVANLLDRYTATGMQRVEEIASYARTRRCRHSHISAYLGGRPLSDCGACDNCLGLTLQPAPSSTLMDERQQLRTILECAAGARWGIGPWSLIHTLRGSGRAPDWTGGLPHHGALAFRSRAAVEKMVDRLTAANLLQARQLDHGGTALALTPAGREAIDSPDLLGDLPE